MADSAESRDHWMRQIRRAASLLPVGPSASHDECLVEMPLLTMRWLRVAMAHIETYLETEGLYRVSGLKTDVDLLTEAFCDG